MKNKLLYLFAAFIALFSFTSCYDDLGNYDYSEINEVQVSGLVTGRYVQKYSFTDTYDFKPTVTYTQNKNDDNYEFKWVAIKSDALTNEQKVFELGTEKELNSSVELLSGKYVCYFYVTDKQTKAVWETRFHMIVTSFLEAGWVFLCDVNGVPRIDMLSPRMSDDLLSVKDYFLSTDVVPNLDVIGKPLKLHFTGSHLVDKSIFYVSGDQGTYRLKDKTFTLGEDTNLRFEFASFPDKVLASSITQTLTNEPVTDKTRAVIDEEGNIFLNNYEMDGGMYLDKRNFNPLYNGGANGESQYFEAAPWCGSRLFESPIFPIFDNAGEGFFANNHNLIFYDQTNQRFLRIASGKTKPELISFTNDGVKWTGAETKLRMIYGENITILKNKDRQMFLTLLTDEKDVWLYAISPLKGGDNQQMYCEKLTSEEGSLLDANSFAFSSPNPVLFYSIGSKVYRLDYGIGDKVGRKVLDFSGEKVAKVTFWMNLALGAAQMATNPYYQSRFWITVGTNVTDADDASCGIVRSYVDVMGKLTEKFNKKGIGKIVDFGFKEVAKTK